MSWSEAVRIDDARWGPALRKASALGQQLASIVNRAGQARLVSAGATLFRLELPTGSTLQTLSAVLDGAAPAVLLGES